jgi:hypothetical protein
MGLWIGIGNPDPGRPKWLKKEKKIKIHGEELKSGFSTMPGSGTGFCQSGLETRSILERKFSKDGKMWYIRYVPHTYEYYRRELIF